MKTRIGQTFTLVMLLLAAIGCGGGGGGESVPAYFSMSTVGMTQALTAGGGGYLAGRSLNGEFFSFPIPPGADTSALPPMEIPAGDWSFLALVWDGPLPMTGGVACAETTAILSEASQTVTLTLSTDACASPSFGPTGSIDPLHLTACKSLHHVNSDADVCLYGENMAGENSSFKVVLLGGANFPVFNGAGAEVNLATAGFQSECITNNPPGSFVSFNLYSDFLTDIRLPVQSAARAFPVAIVGYEDPFCGEADVPYFYSEGIGNDNGLFPGDADVKVFAGVFNAALGANVNHVFIPDNYVGLASHALMDHIPAITCPSESSFGHCLPTASITSNYNLLTEVGSAVHSIVGAYDGIEQHSKPKGAETPYISVGGGASFGIVALEPLGEGGNGLSFVANGAGPTSPTVSYDSSNGILTLNYDSSNSITQDVRDVIDTDPSLPFYTFCYETAANQCSSNIAGTGLSSGSPFTFSGGKNQDSFRRDSGLIGEAAQTISGYFSLLAREYGFSSCSEIPTSGSVNLNFTTNWGRLGSQFLANWPADYPTLETETVEVRFETPTKTVPGHFSTAPGETFERRVVFVENVPGDQQYTAVEFFCDSTKLKVGYAKSYENWDGSDGGGANENEVEFFYDAQNNSTAAVEAYLVSEYETPSGPQRHMAFTYFKKTGTDSFTVHSTTIHVNDPTAPNDHAANHYNRYTMIGDMAAGAYGKVTINGYHDDNSSDDVATSFTAAGTNEMPMPVDGPTCLDPDGFAETACLALVSTPGITPTLSGTLDFSTSSVRNKLVFSYEAGSIFTPFSF